MSINPNMNTTGIQGQSYSGPVRQQQCPEDDGTCKPLENPEDMVSIEKKDKTDEGKIPIIITSKSGQAPTLQGVKKKDDLPLINGYTTEVTEEQLSQLLLAKSDDMKVYVDGKHKMIEDPSVLIPKPEEIQPYKLDVTVPTLGVDKLWEKGFTGKDVTIAVIDTGIHPHPDLKGKIIGFKDFINGQKEPYDDQGHGTHVSGDCAGTGEASQGKYKGTAPDAKLVGIKVLAKDGSGRFSDIIKGVQWATENKEKYNIKVINMSLGGPAFQSYKDDPICQAVEAAMEKGIIPVIAAGNSGPKASTVGSPGMDPNVLTVGALDTKRTVDPSDDGIAKFSSRGPTYDGLTKPDILSPGVYITAANAPGSQLDQLPQIPHVGTDYISISGTSMATPVLAGIVADIIQARPDLTPQQIKEVFTSTASRLPDLDANQQGNGVVQPEAALDKALAFGN
ncbi:MAG: S8 family peptidase [Candidatus Eremiobacteraeota bacterium]|nr:S8 family peptidase [Candidatus Eremiobacteraeota bacterium]